MNALLTLLQADPAAVESKAIQQIVALCGDGKLADNSQCAAEWREYLHIATSDNLFKYAQTCLQTPFDRSGYVLQDIVNECGRRLDYVVEDGLYQGKSNEVGNDGLWTDPSGRVIVVEVKTTDTYRINLDRIAGYRDSLIAKGGITKDSSILLVVGRQDTGDLEAQVRGSRHAWTVRIISVDALSKLVALKENTETASVPQIHGLLIPFEYTRLDRLIEITFTVAKDVSTAVETEQAGEVEPTTQGSSTSKHQLTPVEVISELRARIVAALSSKVAPLVKKSRALYWSPDKQARAVITVSRQYEDGSFWFGYNPDWDKFLSEAGTGLLVLGCVGRDEAFPLPFAWIHSKLEYLNATVTDNGISHWHIFLENSGGELTLYLKNGEKAILSGFKLPLSKAASAT